MAENEDEQTTDDVSVAPDPDSPSGVYDLSDGDSAENPEDIYKQILNMREDELTPSAAASEVDVDIDVETDADDGEDDSAAAGGEGGDPVAASAFSELNEKYLRALADLDNLRKRQQKNAVETRKYGAEPAIRELLPCLDNLERSIAAAPPEPEGELEQFISGTQMIVQQFLGVLERLGVEAIDAVGQPFDPEIHEAMQEVETDEHPPRTVMFQMERGYKLYERLIRPAKVVVSKAAADAPAAPAAEPQAADASGASDPSEETDPVN